jgi:hypothetical protein
LTLWIALLYVADFIRGLAALLFIVLAVAALLRRVRFCVTFYPLVNGSYVKDYTLAWGKERQTRQAVLMRAARKAVMGR